MAEHLPFPDALQKEPVAVLTRYLEGDLSVEETEQLEAAIASDPFIADALEGLKELPEPGRAQEVGRELKFKAHKLLRAKRPVLSLFHFNQYATAAVAVLVVLFVATAAIIMTSRIEEDKVPASQEVIAENKQFKEEEKQQAKADDSDKKEFASEPQKKKQIATEQKPKPEVIAKETTSKLDNANELSSRTQGIPSEPQKSKPTTSAPNPTVVESYDNFYSTPTLTKDQMDRYQQAFTLEEYKAYSEALEQYDQFLAQAKIEELKEQEESTERSEQARDRQREQSDDYAANDIEEVDQTLPSGGNNNAFTPFSYKQKVEAFTALQQAPTDAATWLAVGKYFLDNSQPLKAEPFLKAASRSTDASVAVAAKELMTKIKK